MGLFDFIKRLFSTEPGIRPVFGQQPMPGQRPSVPGPPRPAQPTPPAPGGIPPPVVRTGAVAPPANIKLNLDASQFAPISSADALAQASASSTVRNNPWWGRLDTIPPASDERTLLIDRSLVAYGYFKPEELVEIHKIGDQMLEMTSDQALASEHARAAMAASEAERERFKQQKKAEAAEREQKRAEEILHRKATDIIFLGRGVSEGLADRRSNLEKLQAGGLPVLSTPADLAQAMGIPIARLRWLAYHSQAASRVHYVTFSVAKKSGGTRELSSPHKDMAAAQRWIFQNILQRLPVHSAAHGFVKGRSIKTNALPHVGRHLLVNADLADFFPTITFFRVHGAFVHLGYSPAVATILGLLCTEAPRRRVEYAGRLFYVATGPRALPQGACTSPALSNLIARRLDSRLFGIAQKLGWHYTRYADDLSFSANTDTDPDKRTGYLLARIRHIAQDEGFCVNEKKTRVLKRSSAMTVTGVVVNSKPGVCRKERRRLRAILHHAKRTGLAAQNRTNVPNFSAHVLGRIAFVQMINAAQGGKLLAAVSEVKS